MSEQAPEAPGRAGPGSSAGGSGLGFLGRKFGGFPVWVYVAVLAGLLAWRYVAGKSAASSTTSGTGTSADTSQAPNSTDASQIPQFVNQTYTTLTPPTAPIIGTNVPTPPGVPTPTKRPPQPVALFPPPTGLRATNPSKSGVTLTWDTVPAGSVYPGSYTVAIYNAKGKPVDQITVDTPDTTKRQGTVTLTGLPSGQQLHANVWPNGGQHAPKNTRVNFKTAA